ncbi:MAG: hypothetical protein AAF842_01645 [Planctomycetota bacterium]
MSPADVRSFLNAEPFRPFTIYLSDASSVRVVDPSHATVIQGMVYVGVEPDVDNFPKYGIHVNLRQITRIETDMQDAA